MKTITKAITTLLFFINCVVFSQATISWTNAPANPITFAPGQVVSLDFTYSTTDIDYICVWVREVDAADAIVNQYDPFSTCPLSGGDESHPNSDSITSNYTIPANIPETSTLPTGNKYVLIIFLSSDVGGFANDSRNIVISTTAPIISQVAVTLNAKHVVDGVDNFDRKKYITVHADQTENEWNGSNFVADLRNDFLNGYDVYLGRDTGTISYNLNQVQQDPSRAGYANPAEIASRGLTRRNSYASQTTLHQYEARNNLIIAGQLHPFWTGTGQETTDQGWNLANATATGEYMGRFINEFHGQNGQPAPTWVEIINEPAYESLGGPSNSSNNVQEIANFHNEVATALKAQVPNALVGGFTTAFPNFEVGNFQRWNNRWKLFMDVAGNNMDFWSIHLYDFPSIGGGQKRLRSGSNMEATFDMMDQYSHMSFGVVKPYVISEYGAQMHDYANQQWSPYRDWLHIAASNKMLMSFLERPNSITSAMNFLIVKAEWGYWNGIPYQHRLLRKENEPTSYTGQWVYTDMVKLYQLWSNVNGTRVDTTSDNLDLQVNAYVDTDKAYVIINNLNFNSETFDLSLIETEGANISSLNIKHLYSDGTNPILLEESISTTTSTLTIEPEATIILEYTFDSTITIDETNTETKYYASTYLQPITASQVDDFQINSVTTNTFGEAVLRVGIGRAHGLSLQPSISVNGTSVPVPSNWRGDSQAQRSSFFGVLEIPVPFDLIQSNNTVSITFPDNGGHISTVTLQVFNFSNDIRTVLGVNDYTMKNTIKVYPNPTNGILNISNTNNIKEIVIYNIAGVKVKTFKATQLLDISELSNGLYFLKTDTGIFKKIIKE